MQDWLATVGINPPGSILDHPARMDGTGASTEPSGQFRTVRDDNAGSDCHQSEAETLQSHPSRQGSECAASPAPETLMKNGTKPRSKTHKLH